MDLYFKRHDGHAVTCDDFLAAMADANGVDLSTLGRWYSQGGTPRVEVRDPFAFCPSPHAASCLVVRSAPSA